MSSFIAIIAIGIAIAVILEVAVMLSGHKHEVVSIPQHNEGAD